MRPLITLCGCWLRDSLHQCAAAQLNRAVGAGTDSQVASSSGAPHDHTDCLLTVMWPSGQLGTIDESTKDDGLLKVGTCSRCREACSSYADSSRCHQERQEAWNTQSSNTKKWHAQPHPGKPAEGNSEPQKVRASIDHSSLTARLTLRPSHLRQEYETEKPLPEFVLVGAAAYPAAVDRLCCCRTLT